MFVNFFIVANFWGVVSHGYNGLGGGMNGGGGWYACGTKPWRLVACREYRSIYRARGDTVNSSKLMVHGTMSKISITGT